MCESSDDEAFKKGPRSWSSSRKSDDSYPFEGAHTMTMYGLGDLYSLGAGPGAGDTRFSAQNRATVLGVAAGGAAVLMGPLGAGGLGLGAGARWAVRMLSGPIPALP